MTKKVRIQIPKQVREELGIKDEVTARVENGIMKIEPVENVLDRLSKNVKFKFKSVSTERCRVSKNRGKRAS